MHHLRIETGSERQTERLGRLLARRLPGGTTVALHGTLGAGKTRLVQSIAAALGVCQADVQSPTFVLWHTYHGQRTIHHLDAYRVRDADEFQELGVDECFGAGTEHLTLVEWADRVESCLPAERLDVRIDVLGPTQRAFWLEAGSALLEDTLDRLAKAWQRPC